MTNLKVWGKAVLFVVPVIWAACSSSPDGGGSRKSDGGAGQAGGGAAGQAGTAGQAGGGTDGGGSSGTGGAAGDDAGQTDAGDGGVIDFSPHRKCETVPAGATTINGGDLGAAVDALPDGGTLVVAAGNYAAFTVDKKQDVTICAAPGARPLVNANGGNGITVTASSEVHIEGFEIAGTLSTYDLGVRIGQDAHHVHVWDNWIHDMGSAGIAGSNGLCGHVDIRHNQIWNTAYHDPAAQSAITIYEPRNCGGAPDANGYSDYIVGNIGYHNGEMTGNITDGNCIIWDDTEDHQKGNQSEGPYTGRVLIANNLCVANGGRGVHIGPTSAHADVVNNTDYLDFNPAFKNSADQYSGQTDASGSDDVRFINNVSIGRPTANGFDVWSSTNVKKANNVFYPVTRDESGTTGGYQKLADPGFVNPGPDPNAADFRPMTGSPLIGAGVATYTGVLVPDVDITGKARPAGKPSIGAYEP